MGTCSESGTDNREECWHSRCSQMADVPESCCLQTEDIGSALVQWRINVWDVGPSLNHNWPDWLLYFAGSAVWSRMSSSAFLRRLIFIGIGHNPKTWTADKRRQVHTWYRCVKQWNDVRPNNTATTTYKSRNVEVKNEMNRALGHLCAHIG